MINEQFLKLFASCIPVKGYTRSIICDLQRNTYDFIPNTLYDLITEYDGCQISNIKSKFSSADCDTIEEYIDFLLINEYAFFTENPDFFPPIEQTWDSPSKITNSIIDISKTSNHDFNKIFSQLSFLRCQAIELRFFDFFKIEEIEKILVKSINSSIRSISLVIKWENSLNVEDLENLYESNFLISNILLYGCNEKNLLKNKNVPIFITESIINDESHCGVIDPFNFTVNISLFTESQSFNNCLNKKISIDKNGYIKNCPSCSKSYGHLSKTNIFDVALRDDFQFMWNVNKSEIEDCNVCEFRFICTDCRVYLKEPQKPFSKPQKCKYNPYLGEYEN